MKITFQSTIFPPRIETIHKSHLNVLDTPPPAGYPSCSITSSNVNSTADPADPKIHQKAVKRGFKSSRLPQVCGVSFERLPAWLWTLRPSEWSTILISESDKRRIDQFHPALNKHYHNKFRVISMPLGSNPLVLEAVMWWTSGSEPFANSLMLPIGLPLVEWVTGMSRRAAPDTSTSRQWLNVSHAKVGGSTTSRAKFRVSGVSERIDIPQDLTRSIGHILKYSIRAKPCSPDLSIPHYVGSSKLAIHQLSKVVLVPSHFSATGWGYRPLDPTELAAAFELPDYLAWDEDFSTNLVPLQILRGVMDSVLETQTPPVQPRGGQRPCQRSDVIPDITVLDQEWIPTLQRWLSGTWASVPISNKAVKSDDAQVNVFPWHQRISLLFPCNRVTFDRLTNLAMRRWRFNVIRSFFSYLGAEYGKNWMALLLSRKRPRPIERDHSSVASRSGSDTGGGAKGAKVRNEFKVLTEEFSRKELLEDVRKGSPFSVK
ncbi:hypothetical protein MHU86_4310 [Fragilaria crotonensis]|nr:hypothetical protein MHU86_4310 [Fragilaria crotonensis]